MQLTALLIPGICVIAVTFVYGLLIRWLFRRRLDLRLAWFAFAASAGLVSLALAAIFLSGIDHGFAASLFGNLQTAASFGTMFKLALIYAALPEEAVKIGVVVVLLLLLGRWQRYRSDPAEMLLYSALGFAVCESLLYVVAFAAMPQLQDQLIAFAAVRGIFGGLVHALLGMVAGCLLAWRWQSPQRWLWLLLAYAIAVLLHASFDGSLLDLVFRGLSRKSDIVPAEAADLVLPFLASALILLVLAIIGLVCSRRFNNPVIEKAAA
ncbi:MAG TPA: PrsW family glutamic-type intramembrane protease [Dongiaceae bacterium]|nr:PrsW family glutamic-type intramembrane protease [Dongiaceae bacterium]